ncbi:serine/threonine-protein kinase [Streptomyces sp. XC 2026]|uniref:serine/threonine-protein kinase n=1 Tax=Streptomyces sp. XC 2026 TaxID=2782004 RepID=UPI0019039BFD|nr:serine/threonine-protein kinase [Streptomyces sp. XC 2026]QQN78276.1 protein kinase [Streptomyces sp. XC 2026]
MKPLGPTDPQRVGQYRLLGKLGAGGMGSVYLARSDRGRTVAVKLVQPELARQPEFRRRFQQEVESARRVGGEFTAPVLDCDTEAETPWVATGYVAGPSLHEVVTSTYGKLPERTLLILANGLVKALRDIHAAGLVHRDFKPSNIMLTIDGPRVIDFGIARALEAHGEGLTRTGAAVGSPGFMSPEQCRGELVTPASDIFCLGSVLTFAATGHTPFGDANSAMHALMLRIVQDEKNLDGVPDGIRPLIEDCLAQFPGERPGLSALLERTVDADEIGDDEPWLPGALIAKLGKHAVELLDSEDPLVAPPRPAMSPPPAMPSAPPSSVNAPAAPASPPPHSGPPSAPVTPPPPGALPTPTQLAAPGTPGAPGTPPPSPVPGQGPGSMDAMQTMTSAMPPPGMYGTAQPTPYGQPTTGYGYPGQQGPGYGYPQGPGAGQPTPYGHQSMNAVYPMGPGGPGGPGAPGGPGGQNGKKKFTWLIVAAAVAVFGIAVGVALALTSGDDDKNNQADPDPSPTQQTDPQTDPEPDPEPEPEPDPIEEVPGNIDPNEIPYDIYNAWEAEVENPSGQTALRRMEVSYDDDYNPHLTTWDLYGDVLCKGEGQLLDTTGGVLTFTNEMTETVPSSASCSALGNQTLEMDGSEVSWTVPDAGMEADFELAVAGVQRDSMPYALISKSWVVDIPGAGSATVSPETIAYPGQKALTLSGSSCTWEFQMVSGDINGNGMTVSPGEVTSGGCDPLPAYYVTSDEDSEAPELTMEPVEGATLSETLTGEYQSPY